MNKIILFIIGFIILLGLLKKVDIFNIFANEVKNSLKLTVNIFSFILTFSFAIKILEGSGILDGLSVYLFKRISPLLFVQGFIRPFSSSVSLSVLIRIYNEYGVNSIEGLISTFIHSGVDAFLYISGMYSTILKIKSMKIIKYSFIIYLISFIISIIFSLIIIKII